MSKPKHYFKVWEQQQLSYVAEEVTELLYTFHNTNKDTENLPQHAVINTQLLLLILTSYIHLYNEAVVNDIVDPTKFTQHKIIH